MEEPDLGFAERIILFFERFWFLRGFVAAFAFLGFLPEYFDLSNWDFARAIHAIIVGWNKIMSSIGSVIADFLGIPKIEVALINAVLMILTTVVPAGFAIAVAPRTSNRRAMANNKAIFFCCLYRSAGTCSGKPF